MGKIYDILIVGAGPAGLTAGIYAKRAGKDVAIVEKYMPGGQVALLGDIQNYLGFEKVNGFDLANKFYAHAKSLGVEFVMDEVVDYDFSQNVKKVITRKGALLAKAVILALGCKTRELNIEGEQQFKGRGVSYCAVCDGNFFKDKVVAVIGSGDSAFGDTIYLSSLCKKVYLLTKNYLKVKNYDPEEIKNYANVEVLTGAMSAKILGKDKVRALVYNQDGKEKTLDVDGIFVAIGRLPDTASLVGKIELGERGFIKVDKDMMTSVPGVFACGDVVDGSLRQIVTATGDGALAATKALAFTR